MTIERQIEYFIDHYGEESLARLIRMFSSGEKLETIGGIYGVTKARVQQWSVMFGGYERKYSPNSAVVRALESRGISVDTESTALVKANR